MAKSTRRPVSLQRRRSTDRDDDHGTRRLFSFDRRISLDTIVGIVGMAIALGGPFIVWGRSMEQAQLATASRVAMIESNGTQREAYDKERSAQALKRQEEMQASIALLTTNLQQTREDVQKQLTEIRLQVGQVLNNLPRK